MGYSGNSEYLELKNKMLEVKLRTKNIDELNKIISDMENSDSFDGLKEDIKEFKNEFLKELNKEKNLKAINESKILQELNKIRKNSK